LAYCCFLRIRRQKLRAKTSQELHPNSAAFSFGSEFEGFAIASNGLLNKTGSLGTNRKIEERMGSRLAVCGFVLVEVPGDPRCHVTVRLHEQHR